MCSRVAVTPQAVAVGRPLCAKGGLLRRKPVFPYRQSPAPSPAGVVLGASDRGIVRRSPLRLYAPKLSHSLQFPCLLQTTPKSSRLRGMER